MGSTSYLFVLLLLNTFRLHDAMVMCNTSLKCIVIFQVKDQKVVVDELSNLKKNRVGDFNPVWRKSVFLCVLNCFSPLINRRFIPSRGTATSSSWQIELRHLVQIKVCTFILQ